MPGSNLSLSEQLYLELVSLNRKKLIEYLENYPLYGSQISYDANFNSECYDLMFSKQRGGNPIMRRDFWSQIENLQEECNSCWKFYIKPRNNSIKSLDIKLGKMFEKSFIDFLNMKGFQALRADEVKKNYPDIKVIKNDVVSYVELKYLSAPFLMVHRKLRGRECYEGSTTLDVGKKISAQRELVESEILEPVFYVYWIDFPCIKGVFFMRANEVYHYIDERKGLEFTRKERSGDFISTPLGKQKMAQLNKVYLPLLKMGNFEELMINIRGEPNIS